LADENKQFEASAQKLKKAKEEGQVFKSKELSTAVFLMLMFMMLFSMAPFIWKEVSTMFILIFEQIPNKSLEAIGWQYLALLTIKSLVFLIAPFILVAALRAIFFRWGLFLPPRRSAPNLTN
jgi:flagellar biosynthetic protein FlhB